MVNKLMELYSPDALRLYLGSHHYREAWSYSEKDLQKFQEMANSLSQAARVKNGKKPSFSPTVYVSEFIESMENDMGTPGAVHALEELASGILKAAKGRQEVKDAQEMLRKYSLVFGLTLGSETPEERVIEGWNAKKR
jgi:cysteinyl-tRNA synthetase